MFTILGADGKEYGPVTAEKIIEWIQGGRANAQTRARRDGETEWKTLGEFPEFAQVPPAPAPVTPSAAVVPTYAPGSTVPTATLPLAGRGARLVAQIVDSLLGCIVVLPGLAMIFAAGAFNHLEGDSFPTLAVVGLLVLAVCFLAFAIFQIYLLTKQGQTIGKKLMDVRVVNFDNEANPGFVKVFLLRLVVNGLIGCVPFIGGIYSLVDICFIFRDDKRCIHDLIAGTKVVKTN